MSRIGNLPIEIPSSVKIDVADRNITVTGKLGTLSYELQEGINIDIEDNHIIVKRDNEERSVKALHGLTRSLLFNMVKGVSEGYEKILHIIGTGYSSEVIGPWLKLSVGYSHDVYLQIPKGITVTSEAVPRGRGGKLSIQSIVTIKGFHKEDLGKFSAEVRAVRPPENYKGKGIRYSDENVTIKAGKTGA
ncbi:MAG: 50S ribosomal protein L6 [Candidatus Cloacimonadales bacterium]|jgi:large subunit ribosomal protein L6|nr:50S ribosomal protein L6 [Candidatus Cloacimonadota bacterium]MDD3501284.1 50S ribosomal protein L6 [Candidatus Cloacimonadota bacterium]MDX9977380.1 50S ribosomal protein L6 [Candidatus Cloacimonadales bacterium]